MVVDFAAGVTANLDKEQRAVLARVGDLVHATNKEKPRREDVDALRQLLREHPQVYGQVFEMGRMVRESILRDAFPLAGPYELVTAQLEKLAQELGVESATGLEKMLIDEILTAYAKRAICDYWAHHNTKGDEGCTLARGWYWEKKTRSAAARFERACMALARARRMLADTAFIGARTDAIHALRQLAEARTEKANTERDTARRRGSLAVLKHFGS